MEAEVPRCKVDYKFTLNTSEGALSFSFSQKLEYWEQHADYALSTRCFAQPVEPL